MTMRVKHVISRMIEGASVSSVMVKRTLIATSTSCGGCCEPSTPRFNLNGISPVLNEGAALVVTVGVAAGADGAGGNETTGSVLACRRARQQITPASKIHQTRVRLRRNAG